MRRFLIDQWGCLSYRHSAGISIGTPAPETAHRPHHDTGHPVQDWSHRCFQTRLRTRWVQSIYDVKKCFYTVQHIINAVSKCRRWEKHKPQVALGQVRKPWGSSVSLSLTTKCLDCLSGTQGCTHTNTYPQTSPPTHTYTLVTVVAECVLSFAWLPHTSAECQLSFLFCTWRMWGEWWGEQKHQTTKKVPNNAAIFAASTAASVSLISPSSSSLSLCPPRPPSTFTLPHRISLSSALESSS